jgi:hypothetical protein
MAAYLITDSRYWLQAQTELDSNWHLITAGAVDGPKDWMGERAQSGKDKFVFPSEIVEKLQNHINPKFFSPRRIYDGTVILYSLRELPNWLVGILTW